MRVGRSGGTSNCFLTGDRRLYGNVWSTSCNAWRKVHTFHGYWKDMRPKFLCFVCARVYYGMWHVAFVRTISACTLEKSFTQNFGFLHEKVRKLSTFIHIKLQRVMVLTLKNLICKYFVSCLVRFRPFCTKNECFVFAKLQHHTHKTDYCPTEQLPVKRSCPRAPRPVEGLAMDGRGCVPLAACRHPAAFAKNCFMVSGENTPGRGVGRNYWAECSEAFQGMYYWWNGE